MRALDLRPSDSAAVLRPGTALGGYPERADPETDWLERFVARLGGTLRQRAARRPNRHARLVARVHRHGEGLDAVDDAEVTARARVLSGLLKRSTFEEDLVAKAFALVREAAGRKLGMRHFDVQLAGAWVMLNGQVAEMQTGEGKTLTAALAAATAAMSGVPVHVITVNDYLVARDAEQLRPVYEMLGLTVGFITDELGPDERRKVYASDVTYGSNKQIAFDYLKDRIVLGRDRHRLALELEGLHEPQSRMDRLLLRGLCFAIVDEADSVLIDEARTPLIISREGDASYQERIYGEALSIARALELELDFTIHAREYGVELTDAGRDRVADEAGSLGGLWAATRRREELVRQALTALHLFERDQHYLVREEKVQIIDEYTGRVMPDRSWELGLHQMIEAKEGCAITAETETLARISYQRFFRRYLRLGGMTGTAAEVAGELWAVYGLKVATIPTNRPCQRVLSSSRVFATADAKWAAVVARIEALHREGYPVLVGTRSVAASEALSERLTACGLAHEVLNARQDSAESQIVAAAGQRGRITVATNMAGRGTDIALGPGVSALGGLHVVATERHEARRIDRQLFGRCARQGDPGSVDCYLSIEDELASQFYPGAFLALAKRSFAGRPYLPGWLGALLVALPQGMAERRHARMRRDMLKHDRGLGDLLAFSGPLE